MITITKPGESGHFYVLGVMSKLVGLNNFSVQIALNYGRFYVILRNTICSSPPQHLHKMLWLRHHPPTFRFCPGNRPSQCQLGRVYRPRRDAPGRCFPSAGAYPPRRGLSCSTAVGWPAAGNGFRRGGRNRRVRSNSSPTHISRDHQRGPPPPEPNTSISGGWPRRVRGGWLGASSLQHLPPPHRKL